MYCLPTLSCTPYHAHMRFLTLPPPLICITPNIYSHILCVFVVMYMAGRRYRLFPSTNPGSVFQNFNYETFNATMYINGCIPDYAFSHPEGRLEDPKKKYTYLVKQNFEAYNGVPSTKAMLHAVSVVRVGRVSLCMHL